MDTPNDDGRIPVSRNDIVEPMPALDLMDLATEPGLPALDIHLGRAFADAAGVCLENREHGRGVVLHVYGVEERQFCLNWPETTDQVRRTHNDLQDATENGACGVAIVVARKVTGLAVIERSRKGTGFDYWLGKDVDTLFQNKSLLEVSGILNGDEAQIKDRLKQKKKQLGRSDATRLPAFACVVEFGKPQAHLVKR